MTANWESILLNIIVLIVIAIMGFLLKRSIDAIDKRLANGDEKFKDICSDIAELKERRAFDREYFAKEYVAKDDFIRDVHALHFKIDQLADDVKKLLILSGRREGT